MKCEVRIDGQTRIVELERDGERCLIKLDGIAIDADAVEIEPNVFSIVLNGRSHEVRVNPSVSSTLTLHTANEDFTAEVIDPRAWQGRRHGALEAEGRQQIAAPMPGKVVQLLVQAGAHVESGQGLIVVEAMKMQNEIRSPKTGTIERLFVREGQTVDAGEVLAIVA